MGKKNGKKHHFVAVDVGGTKILAVVCDSCGVICGRDRRDTPRSGDPQDVISTIEAAINAVIQKSGLYLSEITAIGVAIPGVVDPKRGEILRTPNSCLSGVSLGSYLNAKFGKKIVLGNDCNFGALGEAWLGAGRKAKSVFGIFVGTGIGSGFVRKRKLWRGAREVAGEIGHIVMEMKGPLCGCGNRGCFEAIAGRSAIERELREAVERGEPTVLNELLQGDLSVIKSRVLQTALERGDALVTRTIAHAAEVIGYACLTVRHLLDPEWIVLGGGVMEACGDYMWDTIKQIVDSDQLPGARQRGGICLSALGDDAVVLGGVVAAARAVRCNVYKYVRQINYPAVKLVLPGIIQLNKKEYPHNLVILSDGRVKKWPPERKANQLSSDALNRELAEMLCRGGTELVILGTGPDSNTWDPSPFFRYFERRRISVLALPTPQAIGSYQRSKARKTAFFRVCNEGSRAENHF
ncbi:MAG: ROK family protein [Thermogutta sp.]